MKWVLLKILGALLVLAPSIICLVTLMVPSLSYDSDVVVDFPYHMLGVFASLFAGYALLRKCEQEEDRQRIRSLVQEVLESKSMSSVYPNFVQYHDQRRG